MRILVWILGAALLGACASSGKLPPVENTFRTDRVWFKPTELQLQNVDSWTMRGRIAVRFEGKGETGNILWRNNSIEQSIRLSGPFGAGVTELTIDALGAKITDRKGDSRRAASAQALLLETTGWFVPMGNLGYWLLGLPGPDGTIEYQLNGQNKLVELRQAGWHVEYSAHKEFDGLTVPARLTARLGGSNETRVLLVIDLWDWN